MDTKCFDLILEYVYEEYHSPLINRTHSILAV